jgi:hypothetical protein
MKVVEEAFEIHEKFQVFERLISLLEVFEGKRGKL